MGTFNVEFPIMVDGLIKMATLSYVVLKVYRGNIYGNYTIKREK